MPMTPHPAARYVRGIADGQPYEFRTGQAIPEGHQALIDHAGRLIHLEALPGNAPAPAVTKKTKKAAREDGEGANFMGEPESSL